MPPAVGKRLGESGIIGYRGPMGDLTVEGEAAADLGEAIREEIRAKLRTPSSEKANAPKGSLVATNILDTAALRLLSGCA
jgi:hypothetical protein